MVIEHITYCYDKQKLYDNMVVCSTSKMAAIEESVFMLIKISQIRQKIMREIEGSRIDRVAGHYRDVNTLIYM